MKLWAWVSCGWCGFMGCAAPIGDDRCPKCAHPLADPVPASGARAARA